MSRSDLEARLAALKAELEDHSRQGGQHEQLKAVVADLERQLALPEVPDPQTFVDNLRRWEARLALDHPLAASVITNAIAKLESIGI